MRLNIPVPAKVAVFERVQVQCLRLPLVPLPFPCDGQKVKKQTVGHVGMFFFGFAHPRVRSNDGFLDLRDS